MQLRLWIIMGAVLAGAPVAHAGLQITVVEPTGGTELVFGRTPFDSDSPTLRIRVRNDGDPGTVEFADVQFGPFAVVASGGDLDTGHEVFYDVVCRPSFPGNLIRSGLFEIDVCGASCEQDIDVRQLDLSCVGGLLDTPHATVSLPTVYAFEPSQQVIPFTNPGPSPITITRLTPDSPFFDAQPATGALPRTLAAGETLGVVVRFLDAARSASDPAHATIDVAAGTAIAGRVLVNGAVTSQLDPPSVDWPGVPDGAVYTLPIEVRNSYDVPRTITAVTTELDHGATVTGLVGTHLAPGERAHGLVSFDTSVLRIASRITVVFNTGQGDTLELGVDLVAPTVSLTTADGTPTDGRLDFGAHRVGAAPVDRSFTISNLGAAPMVVTSCSTPAAPFEIVSACPETIPVGGSAGVTVRFTPLAAGNALSFAGLHIAGIGDPVSAMLSARALSNQLAFSATAVDFPSTLRADTAHRVVTITNLAVDPFTVPIAVTGDAFAVDRDSVTVPGGATADVTVAFHPPAAGLFTGQLELGSAGDPEHTTVPLSGRGTSPQLGVAEVLDLGTVALGDARMAMLEVHNLDLVHGVAIDHVVVTGAGFSAMVPADPGLAPGATIQIPITFAPTVAGPATGTLAVVLAGDPAPQAIVNLTAEGKAAAVTDPPPASHQGGCSSGGGGGPAALAGSLAALLIGARRRRPRRAR